MEQVMLNQENMQLRGFQTLLSFLQTSSAVYSLECLAGAADKDGSSCSIDYWRAREKKKSLAEDS